MEAFVVKQFFNCLSGALSIEHPGTFFFSDVLQVKLAEIVPNPASDIPLHDISNLVYRLKENALGRPDPIDGEVRNTPELLIPFACELLFQRWCVIKDTPQDYTCCSVKKNEPYLSFVKQLVNFSVLLLKQKSELKPFIDRWLKMFSLDGKIVSNIYALLIPTLTQTINVVTQDCLSSTDLHHYILSEDEKSLFSIKNSEISFNKGEGFFNIDVAPVRFFTSSEKDRIKQKPWAFRPSFMRDTLVDFIITNAHSAPLPSRPIIDVIQNFLNRAKAVDSDPRFSFEGLRTKYRCSIKNEQLSSLDTFYLWELYVAENYKFYEARCASEGLVASQLGAEEYLAPGFRFKLNTSGRAQSDETLRYLSEKTCQAQMTSIVSELLKYCDALKLEQPEQYQRLMNLVLYAGKTRPVTFFSLLKSLRIGENCSTASLLSEFSRIFEDVQQRMAENSQPDPALIKQSEPVPIPPSRRFGILSYFYPSSRVDIPREEPSSVADKLAYSPERGNGFI
ncbi:MAG: hypothetical protein GW760_06445 [Legionella sp.]|jgi:hypothetical protein|nr:hypothetical protein [Legionella sp.]